MRSIGSMALVAAALVASVGCGGDETTGDDRIVLELAEQNGSGQTGIATFERVGGDATRIVLELTNPPAAAQPAHVHFGTCDDLGDPLIPLTAVEDGSSETETATSLERLQEGDLVIHAHKSDAEYDVSVVCAPVPGASEAVGY